MSSVAIVVLGDIGHSPRMQYHAMSLAGKFKTVSVVSHVDSKCMDDVAAKPNISFFALPRSFRRKPRACYLPWAACKAIYQAVILLWTLAVAIPRPEAILVQNPPSIPTLAVARLAAWARGARLVVDWHNFGYTLLALSLSPAHPAVWVARHFERFFGRLADSSLCVTAAMRRWLRERWGVDATVLYDKAPRFFRRLAVAERHDLFVRLSPALAKAAKALGVPVRAGEERTLFTELGPDGQPRLRADRPALLVSSTSWTPDEDFGVLLDALTALDAEWAARANGPRAVCVVTGKGPQRAAYEAKIAALRMTRVAVLTMWLEAGDYPRLLGAADLGVCLHTSSSGLDLPMKVVDMFGAALPVCAVRYSCIDELVSDGANGMLFDDAAGLRHQLATLLRAFPTVTHGIDRLRNGVVASQSVRWDENWERHAAPLFQTR